MNAFVFGLAATALAVMIQWVALSSRRTALHTVEQAYRFHELRDELQMLTLCGQLASTSRVYSCLMGMINVCIRNAGVFRVRDALDIAARVEQRLKPADRFTEEVRQSEPAVQELAGKVFLSFARMLISNDWIVRSAFKSVHVCQPTIQAFKWLLERIDPARTQAFREARRYERMAHSMGV
jgi:hypothetical protein